MNLTRGDALTIVSIVVAVVAIFASVFAARRWGTRRRRLVFDYEATSLLPQAKNAGNEEVLKVTFRDIEVNDPYLLSIRLSLDPSMKVGSAGPRI